MRKNDPPHSLHLTLDSNSSIQNSNCTCKAGSGQCSHILGLLFTLNHYQKLSLKTIPCVASKTSMPQTWHIPQRMQGVAPQAVDDITVQKISNLKRKRTDGVKSKFYCPIQQPIPFASIFTNLSTQLESTNVQLKTLLPKTMENVEITDSKIGPVPKGSVLSYQQKISPHNTNIINHPNFPTYPPYELPESHNSLSVVLKMGEQHVYQGLAVTTPDSIDIEKNTLEQSKNPYWKSARKYRLTSSVFKRVCTRKKDHTVLAETLLRGTRVQTAAMKFGIEHEQEAAESYSTITGNNVYQAGLVINPSCSHLGTSPDRKVIDPSVSPMHGLLEIKCPNADSITDLKYLSLVDNTYKLKSTHDYYYQIMGQMGLTGAKWCDLFVMCRNDYHLERINFNQGKWDEMKIKLDMFYFSYFLPQCVKN